MISPTSWKQRKVEILLHNIFTLHLFFSSSFFSAEYMLNYQTLLMSRAAPPLVYVFGFY